MKSLLKLYGNVQLQWYLSICELSWNYKYVCVTVNERIGNCSMDGQSADASRPSLQDRLKQLGEVIIHLLYL